MDQSIAVVPLAVGLFATTNIDDLFVLVGFFSDARTRASAVVVGQYVGIALLFAASIAASSISLVLPAAYVGLLALAPIAIGLKKLYDRRAAELEEERVAAEAGSGIVSVAAVTIANGGDNISIYTPVIALRSAGEIVAIGLVFALMTGLWLLAAFRLTTHPRIGAPIRRYGQRIVPFVLIALGTLILVEAGTPGLIGIG